VVIVLSKAQRSLSKDLEVNSQKWLVVTKLAVITILFCLLEDVGNGNSRQYLSPFSYKLCSHSHRFHNINKIKFTEITVTTTQLTRVLARLIEQGISLYGYVV